MMRACGDSEAVLSMLTSQAAKLLGCADQIGSIEAGKDADILLIDKDVRVHAVWTDGQRRL